MSKKILVIEDERPMSKALELKLTKEGFVVELAYDGETAVKMITENKYDLILTDLVVPKQDGFFIIKSIREQNIKTPIIVVSNLSQKEDEKKVLELGADSYLIKSNTPIIKVIEKIKSYF